MKKAIYSLFFYACIVSGLLFACQGKQGDPGPAGSGGTVTIREGILAGSDFTFNSITGWWFTGNWPIGKTINGYNVDTNSVINVSLLQRTYYQSTTSTGFVEQPLPYVDPSTGIKYSFIKSYNPNSAPAGENGVLNVSINILGTTTLPSELIFKYYFTTSN